MPPHFLSHLRRVCAGPLLGLAACSEPLVLTVELNTAAVTLDAVGATAQLTGQVIDQDSTVYPDSVLQWSSADPLVATVDDDGLVTAVANGETRVTAASGRVAGEVAVTVAQVPAAALQFQGEAQSGEVDLPLPIPLAVRVLDRLAAPIPGINVRFEVALGEGAVSDPARPTNDSGIAATVWTLGTATGTPQRVVASVGARSVTFNATALAGPPDSLLRARGDGQTHSALGFPPESLGVLVWDRFRNPVPGVTVIWTPGDGDGFVSPGTTTTPANGLARARWMLGETEGTQIVEARVETGAGTLTTVFTATATPPVYNVTLRPLSQMTTSQTQAFTAAAARWEGLVVGNLPAIALNLPANTCFSGTPAIQETVDDVVVWAILMPIDGPGGVLGGAGPCAIRAGGLPALGLMVFDEADVESLADQFQTVVLHELAHVIGLGSLWAQSGFLQSPSLPSSPGRDTHFNGPRAVAVFDSLGGADYTGGKVPVENELGGQGTRDVHWREAMLDTELMTGFLDAAFNPLSAITVASLEDLGYEVSLAGADTYTVFVSPPAGTVAGLALGNDVLVLPLHVVDRDGRVVRVLRP